MTASLADSWARAAGTSVQITSAWGNGALRFASRRLDLNRGAAEKLAKCASWQDLLDLQMSWTNQLMQDYLDGSREFMDMIRQASGSASSGAETEDIETEAEDPTQRKSAALRARRPRR